MLFNSLHFLVFFCIVTPLFFIVPFKFRTPLLLIASCYFYMAFLPVYILILAFTIIIDYIAGILIERSQGRRRKLWLVLSLVSNISILCFFKYYNFLNDNITALLNAVDRTNHIPYLSILLPIGLSFHTFQAMSYTIEVYRGHQPAERNFLTYSLYVMFYPQLVAGPIERPQNLLFQFRTEHTFDYQRVVDGLKLMAWGLFKKVVIADRLAEMVDYVYNDPMPFKGFPLIIATLFFTFQIYCDFSGYSDIAIGSAQVMGFKLMKNFDAPYFSTSISEFWRRWHISLSTWFKDYVYIPLGGNRVVKWRMYYNLFIVFVLSGLWHGASWTFIVWGALHGFYLIASHRLSNFRNFLRELFGIRPGNVLFKFLGGIVTFILVAYAWVFFRASHFAYAKHIVSKMLVATKPQFRLLLTGDEESFKKLIYLGTDSFNFYTAVFSITFLLVIDALIRRGDLRLRISKANPVLKWCCYSGLVALILYFGIFNKNIQFIYFQF